MAMFDFQNFKKDFALPHFKDLFEAVWEKQDELVLDGVLAFNPESQFVEGKIIHVFSYYVSTQQTSPDFSQLKKKLQALIHFAAGKDFITWGTLNALEGLYELKKAELLEEVVLAEDLVTLKEKLHWHNFVEEKKDYALKGYPTNYYGVAYGIARYRELLGWEEEQISAIFLQHLLIHIEKYSGSQMYMDETAGFGRFDRYSLLIPAEITGLLIAGGKNVPQEILRMLKKSSDVCLMLANENGNGFAYGRSIGAYGDTAVLEILSAAASQHLLTPDEYQLAVAYSAKIIEKFRHFWWNKKTRLVNLWEDGRKTDTYRNKNRILGETLNLQMQILNSIAKFQEVEPADFQLPDFEKCIGQLPPVKEFVFSKQPQLKELVVVRQKTQVWSIPLINGGPGYFKTSPYLPQVQACQVLEFTPEGLWGNLIPSFTLENKKYLPLGEFSDIQVEASENEVTVTFTLDKLADVSGETPVYLTGVHYVGKYRFIAGKLGVEGSFDGKNQKFEAAKVTLPLFEKSHEQSGNQYHYQEKMPFETIQMQGFSKVEEVTEEKILQNYNTPHGPHKSLLVGSLAGEFSQFSYDITFQF